MVEREGVLAERAEIMAHKTRASTVAPKERSA